VIRRGGYALPGIEIARHLDELGADAAMGIGTERQAQWRIRCIDRADHNFDTALRITSLLSELVSR